MGKTADLTVVQKTIIDTLHKEGKPQTFIAKEAGCSQSAVSKHVNRKLSGRKKCGRKRCTTNRENRSLMRIVEQNWFKNLCELHKEWTEAGVKSSRAPHTQTCQGIWLQFSSEASYLELRKRRKIVTAPVYQEILEHFVLSSADQLFKDADFIFQQDLAPAHTAKSTKSWLNDHGVGVLDWPANSPDLNPIENLWDIVKRKMRNKRPKKSDELKATVKETWASIPPQQCHKLITSMPRWIEAVIKAKGAPTKYWVHIQYINILSRRSTIH